MLNFRAHEKGYITMFLVPAQHEERQIERGRERPCLISEPMEKGTLP